MNITDAKEVLNTYLNPHGLVDNRTLREAIKTLLEAYEYRGTIEYVKELKQKALLFK